MPELGEKEVEQAIFSASSLKAPGVDRMPALVWQKTWSVTKHPIIQLFNESMRQGKLPEGWKVAKIIPLRKPQKGNYLDPEAFRPISLLPTLSKALESLVAQRISYLAETHGLLPDNHFGARKRRSSIDALLVLQEKIFQAWRDKKVLSLVTFDVKGAFNGVARDVLLERLRRRQIPEALVKWIDDFMKNRQATITVNGSSTRQAALHNAGLPQGSPLSPILYIFFNADLVASVINKSKGTIIFVDDFSA